MLPSEPVETSTLAVALASATHQASGWFLAEGIVLIVLGLIAIALPFVAGLATAVLLGWLFLLAGFVGLFSTVRTRQAPGFGWSTLSALIALFAGMLLVLHPLQGLITLTFVVTAFFIGDGIFMILLAISHRREMSHRWEWMLASGIADLVLAAIVISGLPGTLTWAVGFLVGIDMIFGGGSLVAVGMAARKLKLR